MNIHLLLILLSFKAPALTAFDVMPAPQVTCPESLAEDRATSAELHRINVMIRALKGRV
jgi:hypothetical protein